MVHPFSYEVIYSSRCTIAVQVTRDGRVVVRSRADAAGLISILLFPKMNPGS